MADLIWIILGIASIVLLLIFWGKRNAIWGGFTLGIIIGLIIAIFYLFKGNGFHWSIAGKGAVIGTMAGFGAELLGKVGNLIGHKTK